MANLSNLLPDSVRGVGGFKPNLLSGATSSAQESLSNAISSAIPNTFSGAQAKVQSALDQAISSVIPSSFKNFRNISNVLGGSGNTESDVTNTGRYKVRLVSVIGLSTAFNPGDISSVVFENTPGFTETGGVEYAAVQPIHMPGSVQMYKFTNARSFTITTKLISRNTADALRNITYLQTLRSWRYPFFGASSSTANGSLGNQGVELLGAPPEVLYLYAYSTGQNDKRTPSNGGSSFVNINRVPVVLANLSITYPDDVDYLPISMTPSGTTEPFPIKIELSITLTETHSPSEFEAFSLTDYKQGNLRGF